MTGLLVSVRSAQEALAAVAGGADIVDVKEPLRGPLGAANPQVWRAVHNAVGARKPVSAALGELVEWNANGCLRNLRGFRFAKIGLAGCANEKCWVQDWRRALEKLPDGVTRVAVAYADYHAAAAPEISGVITHGAEIACRVLLVDTHDKSQGGLFEHLQPDELSVAIELAHRCGMQVVLAGSLTRKTIAVATSLSPDFIAVRSSACGGNRTSRVDASLVRCLRAEIDSCAAMNTHPAT